MDGEKFDKDPGTRVVCSCANMSGSIWPGSEWRTLRRAMNFIPQNESLGNVQVAAWTVLAESDPRGWLAASEKI